MATKPEYRWNEPSGRYINRAGQYVKRSVVMLALNQRVNASGQSVIEITKQLQAGELSVAEWRQAMAREIKIMHTSAAALARGGWDQMSQSDWGYVGSEVRKQLEFLNGFVNDIQAGKYGFPPNGRAIARARMYASAGRGMYQQMRRRMARNKGAAEERRVLGAAEHCSTVGDLEGCIELSSKGWQPMDTLPRIGQSPCRTHCQCHFEWRGADGNIIMAGG